MKNARFYLSLASLMFSFIAMRDSMAQELPATGANFSVNAGPCRFETNANGIQKYMGDCHLERQGESSGAMSANNSNRQLYCFNDYKLTANSNGQVIGGATADSWIGCSLCEGERCESFLIPGFPNDGTDLGNNSEVRKASFNAAADPVVASLPDGGWVVAFLAFARGEVSGGNNAPDAGIFLQPVLDMENTEDHLVDALALLPQITVDLTNEQFVDKPDVAFVPAALSGSQQLCKMGTVQPPNGQPPVDKYIPCGKVLTAYTTFNGLTDKNARSKIILCTHDLSPGSKDQCYRADERQHIDSGVAFAWDPGDPDRILLFWRRFATPNLGQTDAIMLAISNDGGKTMGKSSEVFTSVPFGDFPGLPQPSASDLVLARSTAFLTTAIARDDTPAGSHNPAYVCWSQKYRNDSGNNVGQIVCSVSYDGGISWSSPKRVDPTQKNQFQPAMDCAAGQCSLAWYDLRFDPVGDVIITPEGRALPADPLSDTSTSGGFQPIHHIVDVRMAQWESGDDTFSTSPSFQISKYPLTLFQFEVNGEPKWLLTPLQVNALNPLTNCSGTCAFFGDYMDVFYQKWVRSLATDGSVQWHPNVDPKSGPREVRLSWTDNRQVRFSGNWTDVGVPELDPNSAGEACDPARLGKHNQDIYTALVTPKGFDVACPRCAKPLAGNLTQDGKQQRTFLLVMENLTKDFIQLSAEIDTTYAGGNVAASFRQDRDELSTVGTISPFGKKIRTIFVTCSGNDCGKPHPVKLSITKGTIDSNGNFVKPDPLTNLNTASILINAVGTIFPGDPDSEYEVHSLSLLNTTNPTPSFSLSQINPSTLDALNSTLTQLGNYPLLNFSLFDESAINYPLLNIGDEAYPLLNLSSAYPLLNAGIAYPLLNTSGEAYPLLNYPLLNYPLLNYDLTNRAVNLSQLNASLNYPLLNYPLLNASVGTKTWEISAEDTNTTSGFDLAMLSPDGQVPDGFDAFYVVTRIRQALSFDRNCKLVLTPTPSGQELLAALPLTNIDNGENGAVLTAAQLEDLKTADGTYQNLSNYPLLNYPLLNGSLDDSAYPMSPSDKIQVTLVVQKREEQQNNLLAASASAEESGLTVSDVLSQFGIFSTAQATSAGGGVASHLPIPTEVTLSDLKQTYTGNPLSPTVTTNPAGLQITWTNVPQTESGFYTVTATVNEENYQGSATGTFIIDKADTAITLEISPTMVISGEPVTLTASVTTTADVTPTGTVKFFDETTELGSSELSGGIATLTTTNLAIGNHLITAAYLGSDNLKGSSTESIVNLTVAFRFEGFYPNLGPASVGIGGTSTIYGPFQIGSNVTLKWALYDKEGQFYTGEIDPDGASRMTIEVYDLTGQKLATLLAPNDTPGSTILRIDYNNGTKPLQYLFNWYANGFTAGTYIVALTTSDGAAHSVTLALK